MFLNGLAVLVQYYTSKYSHLYATVVKTNKQKNKTNKNTKQKNKTEQKTYPLYMQ